MPTVAERYNDLKTKLLSVMHKEDLLLSDYQRTFNTHHGRRVLHHMLVNLQFFAVDLELERDIALRNFATFLLNQLGIWRTDNEETIIDNLMQTRILPLEEEKKK